MKSSLGPRLRGDDAGNKKCLCLESRLRRPKPDPGSMFYSEGLLIRATAEIGTS